MLVGEARQRAHKLEQRGSRRALAAAASDLAAALEVAPEQDGDVLCAVPARRLAVCALFDIHRHNTAAYLGGDEDIVFMGKLVCQGRQVGGICRQLLYEFSDNLVMLCCKGDGSYLALTAEELLPHGFKAERMT